MEKKVKLTHSQQIVLDILRRYPNAIVMSNGYLTGGHGVKLNLATVHALRKKGIINASYGLADEYRITSNF